MSDEAYPETRDPSAQSHRFLSAWALLSLMTGCLLVLPLRPMPLAAASVATPVAPVLPGVCSESDRFGLATTGGQILEYDVGRLGAGWYLNFTLAPGAPRPAGMAFLQMIRLSEDDGDETRACLECPTWDNLRYAVLVDPAGIWLIGNEPDSQTPQQDDISPCRYAQLYHELYSFIKGLDQSALVGIGGVVQPTPLRLDYLTMILGEYETRYGTQMPIDVWNTHNYVLREQRFYGGAYTGVESPLGSAATASSWAVASPFSLKINELDADTPGIDAREFIELYDGGAGDTALDGLVVVLFDGGTDRSYYAASLDGHSTDNQGYFVLGNSAVEGVDLVFPTGLLQNGPDAAALYFGSAADFPDNTPVTTTDLLDAVVYGSGDPDDPGLLALLNSCQNQVDESRRQTPEDDSNQRCPNGYGSQRSTNAFDPALPTPGSANCQDYCDGCWGAGVPPEIPADTGVLYDFDEHTMLDPCTDPSDPHCAEKIGWKQQVVNLRQFMAANGYQDRPLIISEFGILMPKDLGYGWAEVQTFMQGAFDWLRTPGWAIGYPEDGYRLVQAWAWWPFDAKWTGDPPREIQAVLFDPETRALTPAGTLFSQYVSPLTEPFPHTVDLRIDGIYDRLIAMPRRGPAISTISATVTNAGALASGDFVVGFDIDGQAVTVPVSSLLPGDSTSVEVSWDVEVGQYLTVSVTADPDGLIVDCDPYNNRLSAILWIGDHSVYLPFAGDAIHRQER